MKLDRRTVLAGPRPLCRPPFSAYPARADAKRQSLVDQASDPRARS